MRATLSRLRGELCRFVKPCLNPAVLTVLMIPLLATASVPAAAQTPAICGPNALPNGSPTNPPDLIVIGDCHVKSLPSPTYYFGNVNIVVTKTGKVGRLIFDEPGVGGTDFWAKSVLVQNGASLLAGTDGDPVKPKITPIVNTVTIHLWGADKLTPDKKTQNAGIHCVSVDDTDPVNPKVTADQYCGVDPAVWGQNKHDGSACTSVALPGGVTDCFYSYMPIDYDGADPVGYFGSKVLAVSYGGTLQLFGTRGMKQPEPTNIADSGTSWARLNGTVQRKDTGASTVVLDRAVKWKVGDWIVVSSTDYLPGHAEQMQIDTVNTPTGGVTTLTVHRVGSTGSVPKGFQYPHNGDLYPYRSKLDPAVQSSVGPADDPNLPASLKGNIETRAAVGLLTRAIRIVSEGDKAGVKFPALPSTYSYGGHTMFRQGFKSVQIQGVEFCQLGQGGRIMHYPVHFHGARKVPANTYVKDSSIWDSMTRWITIHGSQGILLQRNVGYLSIGHGFYLEDGTETDNKLYANLGVFARGSVQNAQNPRSMPGILSAGRGPGSTDDDTPYYTDSDHPSVFWIMNGWNDFEYNFAAGAGTCGMCYWLVPGANSGMSRMEHWTGYASSQIDFNQLKGAAKSPLQRFVGNSCASAQYSFITVASFASCYGVVTNSDSQTSIPAVPNPLAAAKGDLSYYPSVDASKGRQATKCPDDQSQDCSSVPRCDYGMVGNVDQEAGCTVTTIDHYTTSFNWAQTNVSAMWLRPQWYVVSNSAVTDVQNGGLTFVSGGGYSYSDEIPRYWALAYRDAFVGRTQPTNNFASDAGPFNGFTIKDLKCDPLKDGTHNGTFCLSAADGVAFPLNGFAVNQRFFNIYDGPS